jgi:hypothetical protein
VIVADPESDALADETAETVTVAGFGMEFGAVYKPLALIVPTVELPPVVPFTCQVTAVFVVPETAATNCVCVPGLTVAEAGVTMTVICGGGVLPPPQELSNSKIARQGIRENTRRMRSLGGGREYLR